MTRIAVPQINFADIEFLTQGVDLDPILKTISNFLDHQPKIIERVLQDLRRVLVRVDPGRPDPFRFDARIVGVGLR